MAKPVIKESDLNIQIKDVHKRFTLNFTDIVKNNNKYYTIELIEATNGKIFLHTQYGRVGGTAAKEYRSCLDISDAESEAQQIIKSKLKKGYVEVKLVKTSVGSDVGKSKVEIQSVSEDTAKKLGFKIESAAQSSLHPAVQSVVKTWFGSIEQFVIDTLDTSKCALGQLSLDQINKGRDFLLEARKIVLAGAKDIQSLNDLSSKYYSNIPMNFGYKRLDINQLRFDTNDKLDHAFDVLDTLEGAKDASKVLTKGSLIDDQYKSLKTEMEWVDPNSPVWKWVDTLFHKTRASNHAFLGKIKIQNVFKLTRNSEYESYMSMIDKMAKQDNVRKDLPSLLQPIWYKRIKEDKSYELLYDKVNVLPLFHGTRTPNFPKILSSKLLMRKPGFTVAGAMFDKNGGIYNGFSSKAINYSSASGSYWSGGSDNKGYLFISDVALGKQKIADRAYPYTLDGIKPHMSVWAKGGITSNLINDEFIVYTEQQNWLRYVVEFETKI
jgi:poly [ADP-ribose] polymerase